MAPRLVGVALLLLLVQLLSTTASAYSLVVAFRQPSRHTVGFQTPPAGAAAVAGAPPPPYALPLVEFITAASGGGGGIGNGPGRGLTFQPLVPSVPFYRLEVSGKQCPPEQLAAVARRCVLTYGLFELLARGMGGSREAAAADAAANAPTFSSTTNSATWRAGVVAVPVGDGEDGMNDEEEEGPSSASQCLALEEQAAVLRPFHRPLGLDPARHVRDERVSVEIDVFVVLLEPRACGSSTGSTTTTALLCRRLARGPAIGAGYSYATTARRPRGGVLGLLSEYARRRDIVAQTPTAMEPELGLLMGNVAGVGPGARVLDPFCGGGSLLLAARVLGAGTLVGTDAAVELLGTEEARAAVLRGFGDLDVAALSLTDGGALSDKPARPPPRLGLADIREFRDLPEFFVPEGFDALVTDPPYDIKEKVRRMDAAAAAANEDDDADAVVEAKRAKALAAVAALLDAAAVTLAPGGRLVFFLPAWGPHGLGSGPSKKRKRRRRTEGASTGTSEGARGLVEKTEELTALTAGSLLGQWHARLLREQPLMRTLPPGLSLVTAQPQVFSPNFLRWLVCVEKAAK